MTSTTQEALACESSNHPPHEPRSGSGLDIYACPYCGKGYCTECEGAALDDGLDDSCDDCWMVMNTMLGALLGEPWKGDADDPDDGKLLHGEAQP